MSLLRAAEENLVSTSLPQRTEPRLPEQRGTDVSVSGNSVRLVQEHGTAAIILDEEGSLLVIQPAIKRGAWRSGIASIIEEEIQEQLTRFFGSAVGSSTIDPAQRLSHVAIVVAMRGAGHTSWRTRDEQQRSPNSATMSMRGSEHIAVTLSPPVHRRAALLHDTQRLGEDFTVRLRREIKG
jgi:hypothetical protein